ncbi:hypothetical protein H0H81_005268 [Sphagnurus paluster]|uniref:Uncharacterized protein n=1 Tax=Sphagnurus paluster TaxID=117069 RepID=A0A9P7KG58_9AGAR|nr:hypothetical protein H0H81_005268 [Sphagnurus paluster]
MRAGVDCVGDFANAAAVLGGPGVGTGVAIVTRRGSRRRVQHGAGSSDVVAEVGVEDFVAAVVQWAGPARGEGMGTVVETAADSVDLSKGLATGVVVSGVTGLRIEEGSRTKPRWHSRGTGGAGMAFAEIGVEGVVVAVVQWAGLVVSKAAAIVVTESAVYSSCVEVGAGLAIETRASAVAVVRQACSTGSSACLAAGFGGVGTMKLAGRVASVAIEVAGAAGEGVIIGMAALASLNAAGTGRGAAENGGA